MYISPKNEYFCITPKNGSAQECGSKGGPHGNISAWKSNITAWIQNKALFLHGEITNLPLIIQCIDFVPFLLINGTWKRINIASMSFFLHIHFSQAIQVLPLPREGYIQHASSWNIVKQTFCIIPSQVFSIDCSINRFEAILILCCIFFARYIWRPHTHLLSTYNYYTPYESMTHSQITDHKVTCLFIAAGHSGGVWFGLVLSK